ncbi:MULTISPECIES: GNAT family N-acetyltransferase [unclassified Corynebacterium]|uniref:GNAT family N-acetyltransferase n=1 Tax=unclassified Corynebacterium TaxID=2624378 RepID=UPI0026495B78|nr:GNAT family N-acetyltransferase [Corynebacterium sp.]MDN5581015.1 GNAT family N-acetyltransferase [Corynebacterium sp.]MDN5719036.1 GNAT family N-acetyltransferase [Corynebacterium sp.]MDN6387364.1 GNAT family N-acetyltransferase [Corynebacterium sp.]MDN6509332.1 GNAT family N-acetyltransferase [Corynebacterium sp.]
MNDTTALRYRPAVEADREFLRALYILTDQWGDESQPVSDGIEAEIEAYVDGWTPEQGGVILETDTGPDAGTPVGGAWLRTFTADDPGAGYVADEFPEVAIAVRPEYSGHGRGTALMAELLRVARQAGYPGVSLAVDLGNDRARHVYAKLGYVDSEVNGGLDPSGRCHVMLHRF